MTDTVKRKIIEKDIEPAADAAEDFHTSFEQELERGASDSRIPLPSLDADLGLPEHFKLAGSQPGEAAPRFSLDDFDIPFEEDASPARQSLPQPDPPADGPAAADQPPAPHRRIARNKVIGMGISGLVLLLGLGLFIHSMGREEEPPRQVVTMIRHPIAIPHYQEQLEFFLLMNANQEKDIFSLTLDVEFRSASRYERFKEEQVLFRDVIYRFMEGHQLSENYSRDLKRLVQGDLLEHLRTTLPQSLADSIRVSRINRL